MLITLYHGSPFEFETPDPSRGKSHRDFGPGFYLAEDEIDALSIAVKDTWSGFLYTFEVDDDALFSYFNAIEYDGFSDEWARRVYDCRMYDDQDGYEVIVGQTAGGPVNDLFDQWRREQAEFDDVVDQMLREIVNTKFGVQWCLATDGTLDYIELVDVEEITR